MLSLELTELQDAGFDLELTGFTEDEWTELIAGDGDQEGLTDDDAVPEVIRVGWTAPSDIYVLRPNEN